VIIKTTIEDFIDLKIKKYNLELSIYWKNKNIQRM